MLNNRSIVYAAAVAVFVQLCFVSHAATNSPPVVSLLSAEPANVIDDTGAEMWLLTIGVSNALFTGAAPHFEPVYVKDADVPVEAKVGELWTRIEGVIGYCALAPYGAGHRVLLVVPAKTDSVRIRFKYASASVVSGRLTYLSEDLPAAIRTNLPAAFWKSAGFVHYGPNSDWREQKVELPLRLPGISHNESPQPTTR